MSSITHEEVCSHRPIQGDLHGIHITAVSRSRVTPACKTYAGVKEDVGNRACILEKIAGRAAQPPLHRYVGAGMSLNFELTKEERPHFQFKGWQREVFGIAMGVVADQNAYLCYGRIESILKRMGGSAHVPPHRDSPTQHSPTCNYTGVEFHRQSLWQALRNKEG
jgi:hypothetical protein